MKEFVIYIFVISVICSSINCHNKYSADANQPKSNGDEPRLSMKDLEKPFRMNKINLLWSKAKLRLTETKLRSLFGDLKLHDKEELAWKQLHADGKDKDGFKEADLRTKFITIMKNYGLMEHFTGERDLKKEKNDIPDYYLNKSLFKDKKLNKLWARVETAGFSDAELEALKDEFGHHQDKIDEYYSVLNNIKPGDDGEDHYKNSISDKEDPFNELGGHEVPATKPIEYLDKVNMLRDKHSDLREGYDRLGRMASRGPNSKDFVDPKVQGLWKIAVDSDFTNDELGSLQIELMHYETRLLKLRHMQAESALNEELHRIKTNTVHGSKDTASYLADDIKKQARKVEKLHMDLETRILQKHVEL